MNREDRWWRGGAFTLTNFVILATMVGLARPDQFAGRDWLLICGAIATVVEIGGVIAIVKFGWLDQVYEIDEGK